MSTVNLVEEFLNEFQLLTPSQKRIWRYLQGLAKQYRSVYPCQETIAHACNCSRDTVNVAIKKFRGLGWLKVVKRGLRSLVYFLEDVLVKINTRCSKAFQKKNFSEKSDRNPTSDPTQININKYEKIENEDVAQSARDVQFFKEMKFSPRDTNILLSYAKKNSAAMAAAIEDLLCFSKQSSVKNPVAFILAGWKRHAEGISGSITPEVEHLQLSETDKQQLSRYSNQDRGSFLLAYEDFKTYGLLRRVKNVAAFITSRFFAHKRGESVAAPCSMEENRKRAQELEISAQVPEGIQLLALSRYLEVSFGTHCDVLEYTQSDFSPKLERLFKKWKIEVRTS